MISIYECASAFLNLLKNSFLSSVMTISLALDLIVRCLSISSFFFNKVPFFPCNSLYCKNKPTASCLFSSIVFFASSAFGFFGFTAFVRPICFLNNFNIFCFLPWRSCSIPEILSISSWASLIGIVYLYLISSGISIWYRSISMSLSVLSIMFLNLVTI